MLVYVKWDGFEYFNPLFIIFSIYVRFEIAIFGVKQAQKLCKMGYLLIKWDRCGHWVVCL